MAPEADPSARVLTLRALPGRLAVCRLHPAAELPDWLRPGELLSSTRTPQELSIVCAEEHVPDDVQAQRGFRALRVDGPLDFGLVGILARISTALALHGISIFVISTFDTDYILVREDQLVPSREALSDAGIRLL